jgi:hypothetical protein
MSIPVLSKLSKIVTRAGLALDYGIAFHEWVDRRIVQLTTMRL